MTHWKVTGVLLVLAAGAGLIVGALWARAERGREHARGSSASNRLAASVHRRGRILYWWDPMIGPSSISPRPGISAMGMKLVPVYAAAGATRPGEVVINPEIQQDLAVQLSPVRLGALHKTVRTVGYFRQAAPVSYAVTVRAAGWIGTLYASTGGTAVCKGDPLFTLYSPQLLAGEEELLAAASTRALAGKSGESGAARAAQSVYQSIRSRLIYLGVDPAQLDRIVAQRRAERYLTFRSPVCGFLQHVSIEQHSFVRTGQTLMRIEQLRSVWLDAKVYENQVPWVRLGQLMQARIAAQPGRRLVGRIFFIAPDEDSRTHTVTVRARFANPAGLLRPGMYALVDILTTPLQHVMLAPASAVIHTGTDEVVLVSLGHGRFLPRRVTTGLSGRHGLVQILSGVTSGERLVTSGQFLIDVESNMRELTRKLTAGAAADRQGAGRARRAAPPGTRMKMTHAVQHDGPTRARPPRSLAPSQHLQTGR